MTEVEFRDGWRLVPYHVADLLAKYNTTTMTYDEAIRKANTGMARDFANDAQQKLVDRHMTQMR